MPLPGVNALLEQNGRRMCRALVGEMGQKPNYTDSYLKNILSQAAQFDARLPSWKYLRRGYETQLNIRSSPENKELLCKYIQSLSLDDPEHLPKETEAEINGLWWHAFSPMAQGQTPSVQGLLSILLLACHRLEQVVHTGLAPIETSQLRVVSRFDVSDDPVDGPGTSEERYDFVDGDVRMGFPTPESLRIHLGKRRLLVNILEAKGKNGEVYYPTFLLDTKTWSLYIYFAVGSETIRNSIVKVVAVAVHQMLEWAGLTTILRYYAPPITPLHEYDVFGHAMVDVFMIFLILRGWVGLDFNSAMDDRPVDAEIRPDLEESFIIPQRDWALGETWGRTRTEERGPYKGSNKGVPNVIAFLGTVICDHMGLNRREYKDGTDVCCIDDWTNPKTVYDPTNANLMGTGPYNWTHIPCNLTNLGNLQFLTWDDVKVKRMDDDGNAIDSDGSEDMEIGDSDSDSGSDTLL